MCGMKNNEWKRYGLSIQDSIDNYIKTNRIKPNFASFNSLQLLTKPLFSGFVGFSYVRMG